MSLGAKDRVPLFPLPDVVLFPHTVMPLHVFEPRYLDLVTNCIEKRSPLGIMRIAPGFEAEHLGAPPICTVGGLGEIVHHERLTGGRFNVLLRGIDRVRVLAEPPTKLTYRVARVSTIDDLICDTPEELVGLVETVHACVTRLAVRLNGRIPGADAISGGLIQMHDPGPLADVLASMIFRDADERQALLECSDVGARLRVVVARLGAFVAETADGGPRN